MKKFISTLCAFALIGSASAQDQYQVQVVTQLTSAVQALQADGYSEAYEAEFGLLADDASESKNIQLRAGRTYKFVGVCDTDCSDLDLILNYENGEEAVRDTLTDDVPIIEFSPRTTGLYNLTVRMYECSVSPCRYGYVVMNK